MRGKREKGKGKRGIEEVDYEIPPKVGMTRLSIRFA
jgi:hypothetical protein